jgi:hypothetical protein
MPPQCLASVIDAVSKGVDPPPQELRNCLYSSRIGKTMFNEAALKMHYVLFVLSIDQQLKDLEFNNYAVGEVNSFKALMYKEVADLERAGIETFKRKDSVFGWFDREVKTTTTSATDDWQLRLAIRLKFAALNSGVLRLLPWESVLVTPGKVPNAPETIKVASELLEEHANVRDAVCQVIGSKPLTVKEMKKIVQSNLKAFVALERSFIVEATFLIEHVEDMLVAEVQKDALAALPDCSVRVTFTQASHRII